MGVSKNRGTQNGWFIMETLLKWMISRYHIFGNIHIDEVSLAAKFHERHLLDAQRFPIGICPCYLCTWIVKMINLEKQCVRRTDKRSTGCFEDILAMFAIYTPGSLWRWSNPTSSTALDFVSISIGLVYGILFTYISHFFGRCLGKYTKHCAFGIMFSSKTRLKLSKFPVV